MFIAAAAHVPSVIFLSSNPCVTSRLTSTSVLRLNLKTPPFLPSPIPCRSPPPPPMSTGVHFPLEDPDLDDDDIWAVIDSAAASRSRKPLLAPSPASMGSKPFRNPRLLRGADEPSRVPADGEVVQDDRWNHFRPPKIARFVESGAVEERRMVVVRNAMRTPVVAVSSPSYESPDQSKFVVKTVSPVVESPRAEGWKCEKENRELNFGSGGMFPSVSSFKHYQNAAMAILEKNDYTMIHGNPFIKKSGWRKISFFFNLSYEIKDKSIEFDEDKNVQRAEFVVRAYMKCGRFSDGWGSCERREKKFLKPNHDIPSTAETRAKNRACQDLLGIGEYRPGVGNAIR